MAEEAKTIKLRKAKAFAVGGGEEEEEDGEDS